MKPLTAGITLQKSEETTPFVVDLPEGAYDFVLVADSLPRAYTQRVQVTARGPNTIRLCPPLVITKDQADFAAQTLEDCLRLLT